jgi:soluble lytic murein transglycosylase-like protein
MSYSTSIPARPAMLAVYTVLFFCIDINAAEILVGTGKDDNRKSTLAAQILEQSYDPKILAAIIGVSSRKSGTEGRRTTTTTTNPSRITTATATTIGGSKVVNAAGLRRVERFQPLIERYAKASRLAPNLVKAVIYAESGGDPQAVSKQGASGLMQIMPATAAELDVVDLFDPEDNIESGTRYLGALMERFHSPELALWAYNAGPQSVMRDYMPAETQKYVPKVIRIRRFLDRQQSRAQVDGESLPLRAHESGY